MSAQQAALPGPGADPSEKRAHRALGPRLDALPDAPSCPLGPRGHNIAWNSKRVLRLTLRHVLQNAPLSGRPPAAQKMAREPGKWLSQDVSVDRIQSASHVRAPATRASLSTPHILVSLDPTKSTWGAVWTMNKHQQTLEH